MHYTLRAYTNLKKDVLRIVADFKAFLKKKNDDQYKSVNKDNLSENNRKCDV